MGEGDNTPGSLSNPGSGARTTGGTAPPTDELFDALSNPIRRWVAWHLFAESEATVDELTDDVVDAGLGHSSIIADSTRAHVATSLHHVHLPKLEDVGLLEYDHDTGTVTVASLAPAVADLVEFAHDYDQTTWGAPDDADGEFETSEE